MLSVVNTDTGAEIAKWYAVAADDLAHAQALMGDYCNIANAKIEFERLLIDTTIKRLKLKRGPKSNASPNLCPR